MAFKRFLLVAGCCLWTSAFAQTVDDAPTFPTLNIPCKAETCTKDETDFRKNMRDGYTNMVRLLRGSVSEKSTVEVREISTFNIGVFFREFAQLTIPYTGDATVVRSDGKKLKIKTVRFDECGPASEATPIELGGEIATSLLDNGWTGL